MCPPAIFPAKHQIPTNTHSNQRAGTVVSPFHSCFCRNPGKYCRPQLVGLQLQIPLLLCQSTQGVQVGAPVVCMFFQLLSKAAVIFVARPASLRHVRRYTYTLFHISNSTLCLWSLQCCCSCLVHWHRHWRIHRCPPWLAQTGSTSPSLPVEHPKN